MPCEREKGVFAQTVYIYYVSELSDRQFAGKEETDGGDRTRLL